MFNFRATCGVLPDKHVLSLIIDHSKPLRAKFLKGCSFTLCAAMTGRACIVISINRPRWKRFSELL